MKKVIIGSTALKHWFEDFSREPNDLDYVVESKKDLRNGDGIEYHLNPVLLKYQQEGYCKPELLLNLKVSHMFWDINWAKHMWDVQFLLKKGFKLDVKLIEEFRSYWETVHQKIRRSDLGMTKEQFFTNNVNENVDQHDFLHTLINPIPMYTKLLKDGCEVELDENKWHDLSFEEKLEVVREETMVMAYERYPKLDYRTAFMIQLKDNIMKHFPQYIALFAIINYICLEKPKFNYINTIQHGLQSSIRNVG